MKFHCLAEISHINFIFLFRRKFARLAKSLKLGEIEISSGATSGLSELERYELTEERKQLAPQPVVTEEPPDEDGGLC